MVESKLYFLSCMAISNWLYNIDTYIIFNFMMCEGKETQT
jgi:hypothetical protein